MYLMYVDESGDTGLTGSPTSFFALTGLVVHEAEWRQFVTRLLSFRKTLRSVYALPMRSEIHAVDFVNHQIKSVGGGAITRHDRLSILRNTIDEIAKIPYISLTSVIVDKARKPSTYDIFSNAWETLFQRFENTMTHGNFFGGHSKSYGMVITDATAGTKLLRMVRRMSIINHIPHDARYGHGSRNIPIVKIIEDPHGKDSAESLPLQMCDVAAYFLHQKFKPNKYIQRQKAQDYYDRLLPVLNTNASRRNKFGIVRL